MLTTVCIRHGKHCLDFFKALGDKEIELYNKHMHVHEIFFTFMKKYMIADIKFHIFITLLKIQNHEK